MDRRGRGRAVKVDLRRAAVVAGGLLLLGACMRAPPVPEVRLEPIRARFPVDGPLEAVAFMAGCWRGPFLDGRTVLEERWSGPEGGLMLGTSRYVREGRAVDFEFGLIRADSAGVLYLPHPRGRPSEHPFRLTTSGEAHAVFEAPEHDYPRRILYTLGEDGLVARIDGGAADAEPRVWTLAPVPCER